MITIGTDYHPSFQRMALVDTETGDYREQRLESGSGALYLTAKQSRSLANSTGPEYFFLISDRV